ATAVRNARHRVRAVVGRAVEPYTPAVLFVSSGRLAFLGPAVGLPGVPGVVIDATAGALPGVSPHAASSPDAVATAPGAADAAGAERRGDPPSAIARSFDVAAFAAEPRASPPGGIAEWPKQPVEVLAAPLGSGVDAAAVRTDGGSTARLAGRAFVVVEGDLTVTGETDLTGALLVGGRLRL